MSIIDIEIESITPNTVDVSAPFWGLLGMGSSSDYLATAASSLKGQAQEDADQYVYASSRIAGR